MRHLITRTSNGVGVYAELIGSNVADAIARNPRLLQHASETIATLRPKREQEWYEHDMTRPIGLTTVIATSERDTTYYAKRIKENSFTRFVKNKPGTSSQYLSIHLVRDNAGDYELRDIWIGRLRPVSPDHIAATEESHIFWETHAHIADGGQIQPATLTKDKPY